MNKEIWKDVPSYEGLYQVSNLGNVKSLPRTITRRNNTKYKVKERILSKGLSSNGYYSVSLLKDYKQKSFTVHQLVAMAFLNHNPDGYILVVDHINNDSLDNNLTNLQLVTNRTNTSKNRRGSSKYTGVSWNNGASKWQSSILIDNKRIHLGYFLNEYDANLAYQYALINKKVLY